MYRTVVAVCIAVPLAATTGLAAASAVEPLTATAVSGASASSTALTVPAPAVGSAPLPAPATGWVPAAPTNYSVGRAAKVTYIVIHATDGTYEGSINWFRTKGASVSSHYVIRASDGAITQMVREADTAWHVRGFNKASIGIEHEHYPRAGIVFTDAMYRASAELACAIAKRHGIPLDRRYILGHSEIPGAEHADPGPSWNWSYYMSLVRSCGGGAVEAPAGGAPAAGLARGSSGSAVLQLQRALVQAGSLREADMASGPGIFGARTEAAVAAFQRAKGLPQTGYYGSLTAAALGRSLAVAIAPQTVLGVGATGADVVKLQTALRGLGYMSQVTGYFGTVTRDAVTRFQRATGVPQTGTYGPLTRSALARAAT